MSTINEDTLSRIKDANDIIDIISEKVHLKKAGKNFRGLCPFHSEKTPSFNVNPDKQFYHCFGCGEGGDIFKFIMKYENVSFFDAAKKLADRGGITIPKENKFVDKERELINDKLFAINNDAMEFFERNLTTNFGKLCAEYLRARQIDAEATKRFRIGCAIDSWDSLLNFLTKKGYSVEFIEKAGLVIKKDNQEGHYDRFRKRIIFPIFSVGGNVIGFGGRVMDTSLPKYLNSPETPVFSKGYNLYGLNFAKEAAGRQGYLIIVEGYLDMISPFIHGIENISATLGTALTEYHIRLVRRYVKKVVLIFDPDVAGVKAALRGLDLFLKADFKVNVVALPDNLDPDNFVKKHGKAAFLKELKKSVKILDFFMNYTIDNSSIDTIDDKISIVNEILPKISMVKNRIERDYYLKRLSERLNIDERLLREELVYELKHDDSQDRAVHRGGASASAVTSPPKAELTLLQLLINSPELIDSLKSYMEIADFTNPLVRRAIEKIQKLYSERGDLSINSIMDGDDEELRAIVSHAAMKEAPYSDETKDRTFKDCIYNVQKEGISKKLRDIRKMIADASREKNEELKDKLLEEYAKIESIRAGLKKNLH